jgi:predicted dehydrogenase
MASTVEHGVQPRLQVVGEKGTLELVGNTITTYRNSPSTREYMFSSKEMFGHPDTTSETLDLPDTSGGHDAVYRDFIDAIREGRQPRCDGRGGLMSLELANAMMLSSYDDRPVRLPLDRAAFSALLQDLQAGKRPINPDAGKDEKKVLN